MAHIKSSKSEDLTVGDAAYDTIGSIVFQVQGGSWTGGLTPKARVRGSGMTYKNMPYQNLAANVDVTAGTAIAADGIYAVRADGMEWQLNHAWTAGVVDIEVASLRDAG